jgi:uncharacterized YigZ family protein
MPSDHYRTLAAPAEFRHKIERSEFLGIAFPASQDERFFEELHRIEKKYFDATHHCWAFRLFAAGDIRQRSSDAGEPSGTAGKPILAALEGADVHDVGVVVVRWYGGVKLGTGGLARAYRETAVETLRIAPLVDRFIYARYELIVPYDMMSVAYRLVAPPDILLIGEKFEDENVFSFDVRVSVAESFERTLAEKRLRFIPPRR